MQLVLQVCLPEASSWDEIDKKDGGQEENLPITGAK